jgi:hypothetical protein
LNVKQTLSPLPNSPTEKLKIEKREPSEETLSEEHSDELELDEAFDSGRIK